MLGGGRRFLTTAFKGNDKPTLCIYIIEEELPAVVWSSNANGSSATSTMTVPMESHNHWRQEKAGRSEAKMEGNLQQRPLLLGLIMQDAVVAAKEREEWKVTVAALM
ncbi:hypothetical protein OS493_011798 [Desmophyllum pertusum]|uniref:Uncharacterized protein n=1 Tax=Desmophyllum pertusum TaxID=174260 RepID=A0A9W9YFK0_9CNID|nr:hypothetical protein OS493_011798 [Desmophyllum pertusum]